MTEGYTGGYYPVQKKKKNLHVRKTLEIRSKNSMSLSLSLLPKEKS